MTSTTDPTPETSARASDRRPVIGAAIVTVLVIAVLPLAALAWFDDGGVEDVGGEATVTETLALSLGTEEATTSCLALDPSILAGMSPAFAGTVQSVEDETVVLEVDRWYAGGETDVVELQAPAGLEALIGGIDFEVGEQYLIAATDGTVNYCGHSGPVTPELQAAYDAAYRP